jgi:hypothetical protein
MLRAAMSPAASGLLRALIERTGVERNRILLTGLDSCDWQSLTFVGERHELQLRILPPESEVAARRLCQGLSDAEFAIPGQLVVDIAVRTGPVLSPDGSTLLTVEALTIED